MKNTQSLLLIAPLLTLLKLIKAAPLEPWGKLISARDIAEFWSVQPFPLASQPRRKLKARPPPVAVWSTPWAAPIVWPAGARMFLLLPGAWSWTHTLEEHLLTMVTLSDRTMGEIAAATRATKRNWPALNIFNKGISKADWCVGLLWKVLSSEGRVGSREEVFGQFQLFLYTFKIGHTLVFSALYRNRLCIRAGSKKVAAKTALKK